ncbi:hypothetical protein KCP69_00780 [Salmonella enterica subsp. enterica]|nr:hypothetical protein KCP69_00780 [Salmonella enterica subsp. enterica]
MVATIATSAVAARAIRSFQPPRRRLRYVATAAAADSRRTNNEKQNDAPAAVNVPQFITRRKLPPSGKSNGIESTIAGDRPTNASEGGNQNFTTSSWRTPSVSSKSAG